MRRILFFVFALFVGTSFVSTVTAQEDGKKETSETKVTTETSTQESKVFNTICPVSSEEADPEITHVVEGKTYAVCCKSCLKKFKADPQKYISKLSEDGKSLKKKTN
jgi:YHS domain-containing protein